jgi:hypothetical protein
MTEKLSLSKEIYSRFGTIKRARKCFLYTAKGIRLTDLYQEGGRALLGWGGSVFTVLKNVLERGITGSYFTDFSSPCGRERSQLDRAVSALFGDERVAFTFSDKQAALEIGLHFSIQSTSVWKPWNNANIDPRTIDSIVFAPPLPWAGDIYILAVRKDAVKFLALDEEGLKAQVQKFVTRYKAYPGEVFLPAPICAAVTRSIYDLIKALQEREEKHWFIYDQIISKYWERRGPYLFPKVPESKYADFVLHCLECHLVISPDYNQPSIVPFGADKGNFSLLKNKPFDF